jgi:hypothetical protein
LSGYELPAISKWQNVIGYITKRDVQNTLTKKLNRFFMKTKQKISFKVNYYIFISTFVIFTLFSFNATKNQMPKRKQ